MHLPRSVFSERQIDILLWLLRVNNVDDVPSVKSVKRIEDTIQRLCGIRSIPYDGALGHRYYVNSLADLIQQVCHTAEMKTITLSVLFEGNDESSSSPAAALLP